MTTLSYKTTMGILKKKISELEAWLLTTKNAKSSIKAMATREEKRW